MGINLQAAANLLAMGNPQFKGIVDKAQQAMQAGNTPAQIMDMMEEWAPGAKEKLMGNQMWQGLKGKSPDEINTYANNLIGTLGLFKK